eukprot:5525288-Ditylum_brightwellii.AAC.1
MFDNKSLLFLPWFRIIAHQWMLSKDGWWDKFTATMTTHRPATTPPYTSSIHPKSTWAVKVPPLLSSLPSYSHKMQLPNKAHTDKSKRTP